MTLTVCFLDLQPIRREERVLALLRRDRGLEVHKRGVDAGRPAAGGPG